jgi:hypothetical protein
MTVVVDGRVVAAVIELGTFFVTLELWISQLGSTENHCFQHDYFVHQEQYGADNVIDAEFLDYLVAENLISHDQASEPFQLAVHCVILGLCLSPLGLQVEVSE